MRNSENAKKSEYQDFALYSRDVSTPDFPEFYQEFGHSFLFSQQFARRINSQRTGMVNIQSTSRTARKIKILPEKCRNVFRQEKLQRKSEHPEFAKPSTMLIYSNVRIAGILWLLHGQSSLLTNIVSIFVHFQISEIIQSTCY